MSQCSDCDRYGEVFACPFCDVATCGKCYERHECEDEGGDVELFGTIDIVAPRRHRAGGATP